MILVTPSRINNLNTSIDWLENNSMIPNPKKFQAIISGKKKSPKFSGIPIKIKDNIYSKKTINFIGRELDNELKFDKHISSLCAKAAS